MLTEGWDANTVTHILGVRAFGTQLLCEQVVGRGLRRMSYAVRSDGRFEPEYAEVYGVRFSFIPTAGSQKEITGGPASTRVRFLEERAALDIRFPRVDGYRFEAGTAPLTTRFDGDSRLSVSTADVPFKVENAPMVGETSVHTLDDLKRRRVQEVDFKLAKLLHETYFENQPWRFPELLRIVRTWREACLDLKDRVFPQYLLFAELGHRATEEIYRSIQPGDAGEGRLLPILAPYDAAGSAVHVDFSTTRPTWPTAPAKSCVSHVVADTGSWEQKVAESLEEMPEVLAYVENDHLRLRIPYSIAGAKRSFLPDFLVRYDDGRGAADPLHLVVEVSGEKDEEKDAKVSTARLLWVPAVNHLGTFGRWAFFEVRDPWSCQLELRKSVPLVREESAA
jgi:type III restriction enzyme